MHTLVLTETAWKQIVETVQTTPVGLETGVKLFGSRLQFLPGDSSFCVAFVVIGPGTRATHQPGHYSGDDEYANNVFATLLCALPGIEWLGEVHVHPPGMTWLSGGDLRTVEAILTGSDDTVHPTEFIAGVMQRGNSGLKIYPYHFSLDCLRATQVPLVITDPNDFLVQAARWKALQKGVQDDRPCIRKESFGSRTPEPEVHRHSRLRRWRERVGAHGRSLWRRLVRAR